MSLHFIKYWFQIVENHVKILFVFHQTSLQISKYFLVCRVYFSLLSKEKEKKKIYLHPRNQDSDQGQKNVLFCVNYECMQAVCEINSTEH